MSEDFYNAFVKFLETQDFDYVSESFGFTKGDREFTVHLSIEEITILPEEKQEKPRFDNIRKMLDYIAEHDGVWLATDDPSIRTIGYTNQTTEDYVSIYLWDVKKTGHLLTKEEKKCLDSASGRVKLLELLRKK